jgi:transcription elongation factor GreA
MVDVSYLTAEGEKRLRSELDELKGPARESLARRLRSAIQQGDLSENADYISAKEEQGFLEGRIQELDQVLKNAVIIDESKHIREKVDIGSHVTVQEDDYEPETYYVVGPKEADPKNNRISNESPIGRALLGHRVGDVVGVDIPDGSLKLRIVRID